MSQHDLDIANQLFPAFRTALNNALSALGSSMIGSSAPPSPLAGMLWIDNSASPWVLKVFDGSDWIAVGAVDAAANAFHPYVGATEFNCAALQALRTTTIGAAPPAGAAAGRPWLDNGVTPWVLKVFDGTDWIPVTALDPAANTALPYAGGAAMSAVGAAVATAADAAAARAALGAAGGGMIVDSGNVDIDGGTIDGATIGGTTPGKAIFNAVDVQFLHVQDQKPAGTPGGAFANGAWRTRTLNTVVWNTITGTSLASNTITLPPGTYHVKASASAYYVDQNKAQLYNITDNVVLLDGTSEFSGNNPGETAQGRSCINGRITLPASKDIIIRHRCSKSNNSNGFGVASSFSTEVFSEIEIWRVS